MGYCYTRESALFLLADGMGGHPQGEVAAQLALQTISAYFQRAAHPEVGATSDFLSNALLSAHHQIMRYATEKGLLDCPRTTLVAALAERGHLQWIHCGDSRLYVVRDGQLLTRTRDHSYSEQQASFPASKSDRLNRNLLFTCLGSPQRPIYELSSSMALQNGDRVMLCSDGLWSAIPDHEIVHVLTDQSVEEAVPELTERALRKAGSGSDNVTVLAMEWESPEEKIPAVTAPMGLVQNDEFQSTIQFDSPEEEDLDEETIERSIAEINEAIRRSAARKG